MSLTRRTVLISLALTGLAAIRALADTEVVDGIEWTYTVSGGDASIGSGGYYGERAVSTSTTAQSKFPPNLVDIP